MSISSEYLQFLQRQESTHATLNWTVDSLGHRMEKSTYDLATHWQSLSQEEKFDLVDQLNRNEVDGDKLIYQQRQDILDVLSQEERSQLEKVPIGALRTFDANAFTILAPDNCPVILYHFGLMGMVDDISRAFVSSFAHLAGDNKYEDFVEEKISAHLMLSFLHFISDGKFVDFFASIPLYTDHLLGLHYRLSAALDSFILAHEFGHHILGHLGEESLCALPSVPQEKIRIVQRRHEQEYKADEWAVSIMKRLVDSSNDSSQKYLFGYVAPILFLQGAGLLEALRDMIPGQAIGLSSHPKSNDRIARIIDQVDVYASDRDKRFVAISGRLFDRAKRMVPETSHVPVGDLLKKYALKYD